MKLARFALAMAAGLAVAAMASAQYVQGGRTYGPVVTSKALLALQRDLITAIQDMKAGLPIYDGDRVRSLHAAHAALVIVDSAISGNKIKRPALNVKDDQPSGRAHEKYAKEQIAQSQVQMRQGYAALQQAWNDLEAAVGSTPNQKGKRVAIQLQNAGAEAQKAIALHASEG